MWSGPKGEAHTGLERLGKRLCIQGFAYAFMSLLALISDALVLPEHARGKGVEGTAHNACSQNRGSRCEDVEERNGTRFEDRTTQEQVPMQVVHVRETIAAQNAGKTSEGVRKAPYKEASATGNF